MWVSSQRVVKELNSPINKFAIQVEVDLTVSFQTQNPKQAPHSTPKRPKCSPKRSETEGATQKITQNSSFEKTEFKGF